LDETSVTESMSSRSMETLALGSAWNTDGQTRSTICSIATPFPSEVRKLKFVGSSSSEYTMPALVSKAAGARFLPVAAAVNRLSLPRTVTTPTTTQTRRTASASRRRNETGRLSAGPRPSGGAAAGACP
jgi:hypothetical protein